MPSGMGKVKINDPASFLLNISPDTNDIFYRSFLNSFAFNTVSRLR